MELDLPNGSINHKNVQSNRLMRKKKYIQQQKVFEKFQQENKRAVEAQNNIRYPKQEQTALYNG